MQMDASRSPGPLQIARQWLRDVERVFATVSLAGHYVLVGGRMANPLLGLQRFEIVLPADRLAYVLEAMDREYDGPELDRARMVRLAGLTYPGAELEFTELLDKLDRGDEVLL